jgi:hypothetical protein
MSQEVKVVEGVQHFQCNVDWEDMEGDARVRHCYTCDKKVHNISAMTAFEAERFVEAHRGQHVCIRATLDHQGIVQHAEPGPPQSLVAPPRLTLGAAALTLPMLLAGCTTQEESCERPTTSYHDAHTGSYSKRHSIFCESVDRDQHALVLLRIICAPSIIESRFQKAARKVQGGVKF